MEKVTSRRDYGGLKMSTVSIPVIPLILLFILAFIGSTAIWYFALDLVQEAMKEDPGVPLNHFEVEPLPGIITWEGKGPVPGSY